jgi:hypothetical protein
MTKGFDFGRSGGKSVDDATDLCELACDWSTRILLRFIQIPSDQVTIPRSAPSPFDPPQDLRTLPPMTRDPIPTKVNKWGVSVGFLIVKT